MKIFATIALGLCLVGCWSNETKVKPDTLEGLEFRGAQSDVERFFGANARVIAVCGSSKGLMLRLDKDGAVTQPDEITGGVIALGYDAQGKPDIVHRDAMKQMIRVSENSGIVRFLPQPGQPTLGTWTVEFPTTGIVENHSLIRSQNGDLVDIWTSTRANGFLPARGVVFISKCKAV